MVEKSHYSLVTVSVKKIQWVFIITIGVHITPLVLRISYAYASLEFRAW